MPSVTINIADRGTPRAIKTVWRLLFALVVFLPCLASCANGAHIPKPPLMLPFEVQKAGSKVETELEIVEHREYIFSLRFGFKKNDQEDRAHVKKLVGEDGQYKDGYPGIPTPLSFKISIIDDGRERPMLEKEILALRLRSWGGDCFDKHIDYVILKPGHYRVSVESLKDAPELVGTAIFLKIGYYAKSTPIE